VVNVHVARDAGTGVEAAARTVRYAVFERQAAAAVALAHNLDDQAETLLLQLTRGAGVRGLAGMPPARTLPGGDIRLVRPLLAVTRADIAHYARDRGLYWIEDESNSDSSFDRNFLRHHVLPHLQWRFPAYRETWSRASRNLADAAQLLDEMAAVDAGPLSPSGSLEVERLRQLSPAAARNVLRWFLARKDVRMPARERLDECLRQLLSAREDRQPAMAFDGLVARRSRGRLELVPRFERVPGDWEVPWKGEEALVLGHGLGLLHFETAPGRGLSRRLLQASAVRVALRRGGERLKLWPDRPSRTVKNLLRELDVAPWQRARLPLLFCGEHLAWVAGVGIDCRFAAADTEIGILLHWQPDLATRSP
ncbi:MAG: tRNA lysidine(34) synthetase TilS, partial [Burkholderiales bacterium]|nr:tRNA lysidine(34) synthetase TilS [Burkholderiales bacterium]